MPKAVTKDRSIKVSERTLQAAKRIKAKVAKHGWASIGVNRTGPASIADVVEVALTRLEATKIDLRPSPYGMRAAAERSSNTTSTGLHSLVEGNRDDSQT